MDEEGRNELGRGRTYYAQRARNEAYEALSRADRAAPLGAADLERLARSAYMLGRDDDYVRATWSAPIAPTWTPATRCAPCAARSGSAIAWCSGRDRPPRGMVRSRAAAARPRGSGLRRTGLPADRGSPGARRSAATSRPPTPPPPRLAAIGERFGDQDLVALAVMEQGHALVEQGRTEEGLRLVDETMVAVTAGELSPIVAGIVYCNTIAFCRTCTSCAAPASGPPP